MTSYEARLASALASGDWPDDLLEEVRAIAQDDDWEGMGEWLLPRLGREPSDSEVDAAWSAWEGA